MIHIPVLQKEIIEYLDPKPNENFIDCTFGGGGHTISILERIIPKGKVLGIDQSSEILKIFKFKNQSLANSNNLQEKNKVINELQNLKFKNNLILICDNFVNLKNIVKKIKFEPISGILFDLGMSSWHLEKSGQGFSFLRDEPLNMRYCSVNNDEQRTTNNKLTAEEIINKWSEEEIIRILKEYGEERFSKRIVIKIIENRKIKPIKSTFQLVQIIKTAVPIWYQHRKIHFATKAFQALRIAVNDELNNLKNVLPSALDILMPGGRIAVISFHSLEDRIVKHFFKKNINFLKILTKKPIKPTEEEIKINPRSRSAKLRVVIKNEIKT